MLIDELIGQRRVLARAQARNAELMVAFADTRTGLDKQRIAGLRAGGVDARYSAGEFAANEVSMACSTSRYVAQRVIAMTRRVRAEAPDAWDAWRAGDIDHDKALRINRLCSGWSTTRTNSCGTRQLSMSQKIAPPNCWDGG